MGEKKSIMRSLGEFFGHVSKAVKTPVDAPMPATRDEPPASEVRRTVEERVAQTPTGPVVLRRTVIDEVVEGPESGLGRK